jgi:hypothetical protein
MYGGFLSTGCRSTWGQVRRLELFLVLLVLLPNLLNFSGCKEEEVTLPSYAENNLLDATIQPKIISTYPPNGGIGPYNLIWPYNIPATGEILPHFTVQFNKLMYEGDINNYIHCSGFDVPVVVNSNLQLLSGEFYDVYQFGIYRQTYPNSRVYYAIGKTYIVRLDSVIHDINGNRLQPPYTFSFEPEPYLRVVSDFLTAGYGIKRDSVGPLTVPSIMFNSTPGQDILNAIQISPRPSGHWFFESDSLSISFLTDTSLYAGRHYQITIPQGTNDKFGNPLRQPYSVGFTTTPFRVLSVYPADSIRYLNTTIEVIANMQIDTSSISRSVKISPPLEGTFNAVNNSAFQFDPTKDLVPSTRYTVTVTSSLRSSFGDSLIQPVTDFIYTPEFYVQDVSIYNAEINVYTNGRIDTTTLMAAWSISPTTSGKLRPFQNLTGFQFIPDSLWLPKTTYTFTIDTSLRSISGYPISAQYRRSFYTGSLE